MIGISRGFAFGAAGSDLIDLCFANAVGASESKGIDRKGREVKCGCGLFISDAFPDRLRQLLFPTN